MSKAVSIADELRRRIVGGEFAPGHRLPSQIVLMAEHAVSKQTISAAVNLLANEGLVDVSPGRGRGAIVRSREALAYYANRAEDPQGATESDAFFSEAISQGLAPSQEMVVGAAPLPDVIAGLLGLEPGVEAVRRLCIRKVDGIYNSLQDSWYPMALADEFPELLRSHDIRQGTTRFLAEKGHVQVAFMDQNTARMPTVEERDLLKLGIGSPVLEHRRTGFTADRVPVRVSVNVFVGDRAVVAYTLGQAAGLPGASR